MARSAAYAPFHRVMGRVATGSGGAAQPPYVAPSADAVGRIIQDARLPWNSAASGTSPQVIGWYDGAGHPMFDYVPAALSTTNIAAAQAGAVGAMTLVSSSGSGIIVASAATLMFPSLLTAPIGTLFIDAIPTYDFFGNVGTPPQLTGCYDPGTMCGRCVTFTSVGNDSAATATILGYDMYGYVTHCTTTLANAGAVTCTKAFKGITSITLAGTLSGSNVSAGVSDVYGLPFYGATSPNTIWGFWNSLILSGAGTYTPGVTTSPATATTGDVRGTYLVGSASNGTKRLTLWMHPSVSRMITAGVNIGMFGVAQF